MTIPGADMPFDQIVPDTTWAVTSGGAIGPISSHFPSTDPELQSSNPSSSKLATPRKGSPAVRNQDIDANHPDHDRVIASSIPTPRPVIDAHGFTAPKTPNIDRVPYSSQSDDLVSGALSTSATRFASTISVSSHSRRALILDTTMPDKRGHQSRQSPSRVVARTRQESVQGLSSSHYSPNSQNPPNIFPILESIPTTTLLAFLTSTNPAVSLVRNIPFPSRETIKHFWWDIRDIHTWTGLDTRAIVSLPDGLTLTSPVPASYLPQPILFSHHPGTEDDLHSIYALYYLPKVNMALEISSDQPLHFSVPPKTVGMDDLLFVANVRGEPCATMSSNKPTARIVGLVRSFSRFNTGMRNYGNKLIEYLRGLSAIHHAMREYGCRYGFILTEIELVLVRNGTATVPFFGDLEIAPIPLAIYAPGSDTSVSIQQTPLTACLALWGLCQLASDKTPPGHMHWRSELGIPAEGTRQKTQPPASWIPQPQIDEIRVAERDRGWVWPEDPVSSRELGKAVVSTTPRSNKFPSSTPKKDPAPLVPAVQGPEQPRSRGNKQRASAHSWEKEAGLGNTLLPADSSVCTESGSAKRPCRDECKNKPSEDLLRSCPWDVLQMSGAANPNTGSSMHTPKQSSATQIPGMTCQGKMPQFQKGSAEYAIRETVSSRRPRPSNNLLAHQSVGAASRQLKCKKGVQVGSPQVKMPSSRSQPFA